MDADSFQQVQTAPCHLGWLVLPQSGKVGIVSCVAVRHALAFRAVILGVKDRGFLPEAAFKLQGDHLGFEIAVGIRRKVPYKRANRVFSCRPLIREGAKFDLYAPRYVSDASMRQGTWIGEEENRRVAGFIESISDPFVLFSWTPEQGLKLFWLNSIWCG